VKSTARRSSTRRCDRGYWAICLSHCTLRSRSYMLLGCTCCGFNTKASRHHSFARRSPFCALLRIDRSGPGHGTGKRSRTKPPVDVHGGGLFWLCKRVICALARGVLSIIATDTSLSPPHRSIRIDVSPPECLLLIGSLRI